MGLFDINYDTVVWQALPVRLRQPIAYSWLKVLVWPVKWLYNLFRINRQNNLYTLAHNGQVCFIEAVLNDTFDPVSRGIFISDTVYYDPVFIYLDDEEKPVFIDLDSEIGTGVIAGTDPVPLYMDGEVYIFGGLTFVVNVPIAVIFDMVRLRALVDKFRLPGRSYSVVTF